MSFRHASRPSGPLTRRKATPAGLRAIRIGDIEVARRKTRRGGLGRRLRFVACPSSRSWSLRPSARQRIAGAQDMASAHRGTSPLIEQLALLVLVLQGGHLLDECVIGITRHACSDGPEPPTDLSTHRAESDPLRVSEGVIHWIAWHETVPNTPAVGIHTMSAFSRHCGITQKGDFADSSRLQSVRLSVPSLWPGSQRSIRADELVCVLNRAPRILHSDG